VRPEDAYGTYTEQKARSRPQPRPPQREQQQQQYKPYRPSHGRSSTAPGEFIYKGQYQYPGHQSSSYGSSTADSGSYSSYNGTGSPGSSFLYYEPNARDKNYQHHQQQYSDEGSTFSVSQQQTREEQYRKHQQQQYANRGSNFQYYQQKPQEDQYQQYYRQHSSKPARPDSQRYSSQSRSQPKQQRESEHRDEARYPEQGNKDRQHGQQQHGQQQHGQQQHGHEQYRQQQYGQQQQQTTPPRSGDTFDPYEVLSIPRTATCAEVRKAYKQASFRNHPDKATAHGISKEDADKAMVKINLAKEILYDTVTRVCYNYYGLKSAQNQSVVEHMRESDLCKGVTNEEWEKRWKMGLGLRRVV
jgi:DnaJ-domain-containing protein 1